MFETLNPMNPDPSARGNEVGGYDAGSAIFFLRYKHTCTQREREIESGRERHWPS
jgi:hypothetical protein